MFNFFFSSFAGFQSTYLYKVRPLILLIPVHLLRFQSTYLYKVRLSSIFCLRFSQLFQSTYLYKVRRRLLSIAVVRLSFNPRTYIRYDSCWSLKTAASRCFNPRTYIRYDNIKADTSKKEGVSIHVPI